MRTVTIPKPRAEFCNDNCRQSFLADLEHNLIYGPQLVTLDDGETVIAANRQTWSELTLCCAYCNAAILEQGACSFPPWPDDQPFPPTQDDR